MIIRSAQFTVSNSKVSDCPPDQRPEYAFIGRSNVGKSSLINMLTGHGGLAKTSGTPGKTQLINHFLINDYWYLVDLPGYGYARVAKTERVKFRKLIEDYFRTRTQLLAAFVLIDIRHQPQPADLEFMSWLHGQSVSFSLVFTKADKLKPRAVDMQVQEYLSALTAGDWEEAPPHFVTSSEKALGREELLNHIDEINREYERFKNSRGLH